MKAFEFFVEPDEKRAKYEFVPTKEFVKSLGNENWENEFSKRICWAFYDTMSRFEGGSNLYGELEIPALYIDAAKGDGTVHVYLGNRRYIKDLTDDLKGQKEKAFDKAQDKLIKKVTTAIKEYIETVEKI